MPQRKILIVDDEKDFVSLFTLRLEAAGYKVIVAYDGREAIEKASKDSPDLVLLDIMIPILNGLEVLLRLRNNQQTKYMPVIITTCKGESRTILEAEKLGATDYLIKPFDSKELLRLVRRYI